MEHRHETRTSHGHLAHAACVKDLLDHVQLMPFFPMADPGRPDMDMVRSGLFLGSQTAEEAPIASLQALGITHVLQLGTNYVTMSPSHPDELTYLCIDIHDKDEVDLMKALQKYKVMEFIDSAIQYPNSLLVHCQTGMSRSATTVIVYLMLREGLTFWDALVQTISARQVVQPNPGFCRQAKAVERCNGKLKKYKGPDKKDVTTDWDWLHLIDQAQQVALVDSSHWKSGSNTSATSHAENPSDPTA